MDYKYTYDPGVGFNPHEIGIISGSIWGVDKTLN